MLSECFRVLQRDRASKMCLYVKGDFFLWVFSLIQYCFIYSFYFCLCWVFIASRRLSLVVASQGYSRCAVTSLVEHGLKGMQVSAVAARGFSSWGTWALLPCGQVSSYSWTRDWNHNPCIDRWITTWPLGKYREICYKGLADNECGGWQVQNLQCGPTVWET